MRHPTTDRILKSTLARDKLLERIRSGHYEPGQRLPSERELASEFGLNHITVRRGMEELVAAGIITKLSSVGNFVREIRPNEVATRVAIVLPRWLLDGTMAHPVTGILLQTVLEELDRRDYVVSLISHASGQMWPDIGRVMIDRGIQGAMIWPYTQMPREHFERLLESGMKTVLLECPIAQRNLPFSTVTIDYTAAYRQALNRLVDLGHRRIAVVRYALREHDHYRDACESFAKDLGLDDIENLIEVLPYANGEFNGPADYSAISRIFDRKPRPTALVVWDEYMAYEVFRQCFARGIQISRDLSLVAIVDATPAAHPVSLSAGDAFSATREMARKAVWQLKHLLSASHPREKDLIVSTSIQWKNSIGPCPVDVPETPGHPPAGESSAAVLAAVIGQLQRLQSKLTP